MCMSASLCVPVLTKARRGSRLQSVSYRSEVLAETWTQGPARAASAASSFDPEIFFLLDSEAPKVILILDVSMALVFPFRKL